MATERDQFLGLFLDYLYLSTELKRAEQQGPPRQELNYTDALVPGHGERLVDPRQGLVRITEMPQSKGCVTLGNVSQISCHERKTWLGVAGDHRE